MTPARQTSASAARGPAIERERALLLRRTHFGETSLVVHALTAHRGRIELIAKGAYRPKSRFCGVLDWFDTLDLEWMAPRLRTDRASAAPAGLATLRAGDIATRRRRITRSLDAYRSAQTMVELLEMATRAGFADAELFALGEDGLDALDALPGSPAETGAVTDAPQVDRAPAPATALLAAFELQLLRSLGLSPALLRCASCGDEARAANGDGNEPRVFFSAQAGGRLCATHASATHASGLRVGTLPQRVLEAAARLEDSRLAATGPLSEIDGALAERVLDFAARFLDHHLEARPRSHGRFLSAPDRNRRV